MENLNCTHLLFVYGSMKKNFMNHSRLAETAIFLGEAITNYKYIMYPADSYKFPYVLEHENKYKIKGELYSMGDELLKVLDIFEGHPKYYIRKMIEVKINNMILNAFIYFRANTNPKEFDNSNPIDEWKLEHEYLGYKSLENELYSYLKEKIDG